MAFLGVLLLGPLCLLSRASLLDRGVCWDLRRVVWLEARGRFCEVLELKLLEVKDSLRHSGVKGEAFRDTLEGGSCRDSLKNLTNQLIWGFDISFNNLHLLLTYPNQK